MKKLIALLLAMVLVLSLAACNGQPDETKGSEPAGTQGTEPAGTQGGEDTPAELTYAIVPKSAGNPYNERMAQGFTEACEKLDVTPVVQYPEDTSAEAQIQVINNLVAQGVNGIAVGANDAEALESTLQAAKDQGVTVVTLDSDTKGSQLFVNQAGVTEVAQALVDSIFEMAEGEGKFAVLSASSTATNQNAWIAAMETIIAGDEKYAKLEWVETVYGDDEPQKSTDQTASLLTNYADLEVICCPTTVGVLAAAQYVQNEGSSVKIAGLGLPSEMNGYVGADKVCPYMYLWNPIDVGACSAYAIAAIAEGLTAGAAGETFTAANGVEYTVLAGDESVGVYSTQIIVGPPFKFTEENIADWATVY